MAEAVDTLITLGWAALGWLVVLSAAVTVVVLAVAGIVGWGACAAWRGLGGALAAVRAAGAVRDQTQAHGAPQRCTQIPALTG
ncbi:MULTISPECIES: hypothetical protein [unclassified Streptomyces]|uniref:hypothetical protein n=1 Tax=unclassified Streptomyces TaxID=2593676 RepID=UPI000DD85BFE|nr:MULTISPECIES: hypothetical protein [unclassified Streptomyces]QZZ26557.1 hypothetical protein A7X85_10075 [Streptomyces sp. ST1015]